MSPAITLNPKLDLEALSQAFSADKRLQISNFLTDKSAITLEESLHDMKEWHLVMNDRDRHIDLPVSQLAQIGLEKIKLAIKQATARAADEFQYIYENYPVSDAYQSGRLENSSLRAIFDTMNSAETRRTLNQITGLQIDFCDMQATKYREGHTLTEHDDNVQGKNRQFAYVLSLSRDWQPIWGGQLQFLDEENRITDSFVPAFNTLSIFQVPVKHHVTQIASFAPKPRLSLTGWFRQKR